MLELDFSDLFPRFGFGMKIMLHIKLFKYLIVCACEWAAVDVDVDEPVNELLMHVLFVFFSSFNLSAG